MPSENRLHTCYIMACLQRNATTKIWHARWMVLCPPRQERRGRRCKEFDNVRPRHSLRSSCSCNYLERLVSLGGNARFQTAFILDSRSSVSYEWCLAVCNFTLLRNEGGIDGYFVCVGTLTALASARGTTCGFWRLWCLTIVVSVYHHKHHGVVR